MRWWATGERGKLLAGTALAILFILSATLASYVAGAALCRVAGLREWMAWFFPSMVWAALALIMTEEKTR